MAKFDFLKTLLTPQNKSKLISEERMSRTPTFSLDFLNPPEPEPIMSVETAPKQKPSEFLFGPKSAKAATTKISKPPVDVKNPTSGVTTTPPTPDDKKPEQETSWLDDIVNRKGLGLALQSLGSALPVALSGKPAGEELSAAIARPYQAEMAREEAAKERASKEAMEEKKLVEERAKIKNEKDYRDKMLDLENRKLTQSISDAELASGKKFAEEERKILTDRGTETDIKNSNALNRMARGEKIMSELAKSPAQEEIIKKALASVKGELIKSVAVPDAPDKVELVVNEAVFKNLDPTKANIVNRYVNGALEFALGRMRAESGATVASSEYNSEFKTILPSIARLDSDAKNSRETAIGTMYGNLKPGNRLVFLDYHPDVIPPEKLDSLDKTLTDNYSKYAEARKFLLDRSKNAPKPSLDAFSKLK